MRNRRGFCDGFEIFDDIFKDIGGMFLSEEGMNFRSIYSDTFPPSNIILKENKNMVFEFAVAGYDQDEINISFEGDKMILEINKKDRDVEGDKYLIRGIRNSSCKSSYFVPVSKYNTSEATASIKEGLLVVEVPAREETKPKKISIEKK